MGIRGLTGFVDERAESILVTRQVADESLVIDGWNLCHWLYCAAFKLTTQFNGDYYDFSLAIRSFFDSLATCHIQPYVLLDASDPDKERAALQMERAKERVRVGCRGIQFGSLTPILAEQVFVRTLQQLAIPHSAVDDADRRIADMALKQGALVLTNDSDFFVFDLPSGVAVLDYFDISVKNSNGSSYLQAEVFLRKNFVRYLSTICDYLPQISAPGDADAYLQTAGDLLPILAASIQFPELYFRLRQLHGTKKSQLANGAVAAVFRVLLRSLDKDDPWQSAVDELSLRLPTGSRSQFLKEASKARQFYRDDLLSVGNRPPTASVIANVDQVSVSVRSLLAEGRLSRLLCGDVLVHRRVLLRCLFEEAELPGCFSVSSYARKNLYTLLFHFARIDQGNVAVVEYNRAGRKFKPSDPMSLLPILHWQKRVDVAGMIEEEKLRLIDRCLFSRIDDDDTDESRTQLILSTLSNCRRRLSQQLEQIGNKQFPVLFSSVVVAWLHHLTRSCHDSGLETFAREAFIAAMSFCSAAVTTAGSSLHSGDLFQKLIKELVRLGALDSPLIGVINHLFGLWQPFCLIACDLAALLDLDEEKRVTELTCLALPEMYHGTLLVLLVSWLFWWKKSMMMTKDEQTDVVDVVDRLLNMVMPFIVEARGDDEKKTGHLMATTCVNVCHCLTESLDALSVMNSCSHSYVEMNYFLGKVGQYFQKKKNNSRNASTKN